MLICPVPEPPSAVKALVMTGESILVSWKPPTQPNGVVVQYTVYVKEESEESKDVSHISILRINSLLPNSLLERFNIYIYFKNMNIEIDKYNFIKLVFLIQEKVTLNYTI